MQLPNGSSISIGTLNSSPITMSALSNASPAVATAAAHGLTDADIVVVNSGWELLAGRLARVDNSNTGTLELEGIDTTNTGDYPPGTGGGTLVKVNSWTEITDIINPASSGGEQQFYTYQTLRQRRQKQLPTTVTPVVLTMQAVDDISKPWYAAVKAAAQGGTPVPCRIQLSNGGLIYMNGYWGLLDVPTLTVNEGMLLGITFSLEADITRYAS